MNWKKAIKAVLILALPVLVAWRDWPWWSVFGLGVVYTLAQLDDRWLRWKAYAAAHPRKLPGALAVTYVLQVVVSGVLWFMATFALRALQHLG